MVFDQPIVLRLVQYTYAVLGNFLNLYRMYSNPDRSFGRHSVLGGRNLEYDMSLNWSSTIELVFCTGATVQGVAGQVSLVRQYSGLGTSSYASPEYVKWT
jgi:hypothetical protein